MKIWMMLLLSFVKETFLYIQEVITHTVLLFVYIFINWIFISWFGSTKKVCDLFIFHRKKSKQTIIGAFVTVSPHSHKQINNIHMYTSHIHPWWKVYTIGMFIISNQCIFIDDHITQHKYQLIKTIWNISYKLY